MKSITESVECFAMDDECDRVVAVHSGGSWTSWGLPNKDRLLRRLRKPGPVQFVGLCHERGFFIADSNGKDWAGLKNSPLFDELKRTDPNDQILQSMSSYCVCMCVYVCVCMCVFIGMAMADEEYHMDGNVCYLFVLCGFVYGFVCVCVCHRDS